jgi:hypothetical protein
VIIAPYKGQQLDEHRGGGGQRGQVIIAPKRRGSNMCDQVWGNW